MRHYNQLWLSISVAAGLSALGAAQSTADTIYTYTGNPFTSANSPYTTSDFISGSFDLATPLGNNVPLSIIAPVLISWTFSDGVQTLASTPVASSIIRQFAIATGPTGLPLEWIIIIDAPTTFIDHIQTCSGATLPCFDFIFSSNLRASDNGVISLNAGDVPLNPGTWSISTTSVPGPTIGSGLTGFILAGGGLLVWWRARRKTGKSHSVALAAA